MTTGYVIGVTSSGGGGGGGDITTGDFKITSPSGNYYNLYQDKGTSSGSADTTVATISIPTTPDGVYFVKSSISAIRTSGGGTAGDSAVYEIVSRFTMVSGSLAEMTEFSPITDESDMTWVVRHDFSGSNVLVIVNGTAGETINWYSNNTIERAI